MAVNDYDSAPEFAAHKILRLNSPTIIGNRAFTPYVIDEITHDQKMWSARMNMMKATIVAAALAAASLGFGGAANAAPVGAIGKALSTQQTADQLQQVRHRRYHRHRHYHRRGWRRHRGYGYYRPYRRPGFGIYIGPRYGYGYRRGWY